MGSVAYFCRVKRLTREANHSLPSSGEIESEWSCNPNRNALMACTATRLLLRSSPCAPNWHTTVYSGTANDCLTCQVRMSTKTPSVLCQVCWGFPQQLQPMAALYMGANIPITSLFLTIQITAISRFKKYRRFGRHSRKEVLRCFEIL